MATTSRTVGPFAALVAAGALGAAFAHVPLRHPGSGQALRWTNGSNIGYVINAGGSDDLEPGEHASAVRLAAEAWNAAPGSFARLVESTSPSQQNSTNWPADALHMVLFDEDNASGFFPLGSSTVALTPVWFLSSGAITDADILFNGSDYRFTTSGASGRFDVQDVAVHEFGHLLGFDHSPVAGSSLFPYVTPGLVLHRSLSSDDAMAARARYPFADEARLEGRVERSGGSSVAYAHAVLRGADGRTVGAALCGEDGRFLFESVEAGTYTLWLVPLDGPVTATNLTGAPLVDVDFEATPHGPFVIAAGLDTDLGDLVVGDDVLVSLGRPFDPLPLGATIGATRSHVLRGVGLAPGSTLTASDPNLTLVVHGWFQSSVSFSVTVPANEEPGLVDLLVTTPFGDRALLPGALEIAPPAPEVDAVVPNLADTAGGTAILVQGDDFRSGANVVIAGHIFRDGASSGATVLDASRIALTLPPLAAGTYDVVVIDESGVEGRLVDGLVVGSTPSIASVFPLAGSTAGGTRVTLCGSGFDPGLSVAIGGVVQTLDEVATDHVEFVTAGGVAGTGLPLVVTNPSGAASAASFDYVLAPDPAIAAVTPPDGSSAGGQWVDILGTGLRHDLEVRFGADPATGLGGALAEAVVVTSPSAMRAIVPPGSGTVGIVLRDPDTGQAAALPAAYTYRSASRGGGCAGLVDTDGPGAPWLRGLGPVLVVAAFCLWRARAARRTLSDLEDRPLA
jgi:hypothetical protein